MKTLGIDNENDNVNCDIHNPNPAQRQATHSPLPWTTMARINQFEDLQPMVSIWAGRETKESIVCNSCSPSDARFIIRSVNNAERLAEAATKLVAYIDRNWPGKRSQRIPVQELREALAQWEAGK